MMPPYEDHYNLRGEEIISPRVLTLVVEKLTVNFFMIIC